jgi:YtoQ family protein
VNGDWVGKRELAICPAVQTPDRVVYLDPVVRFKHESDGESTMDLTVYLAGEIHSDWRQQIVRGTAAAGLPISFLSPVTDHAASDEVGVGILGAEDDAFWKDHKGGKINAIRTRTAIKRADLVVVKFGDKYKQWNAAFDAGFAAALGKPIIVIHDPSLTHALKELDAAALAVAQTPDQAVEILRYVTTKE